LEYLPTGTLGHALVLAKDGTSRVAGGLALALRVAELPRGARFQALPTAEYVGLIRALALAVIRVARLTLSWAGVGRALALARLRVAYLPPATFGHARATDYELPTRTLALALRVARLTRGRAGVGWAPALAIREAYLPSAALRLTRAADQELPRRTLALAAAGNELLPPGAVTVDAPVVAFRGARRAHAPSPSPYLPRHGASLSSSGGSLRGLLRGSIAFGGGGAPFGCSTVHDVSLLVVGQGHPRNDRRERAAEQ
jgi:hypothetical protein